MSSLAEANKAAPGRWVLMPKKGQPLLDPGGRNRAKVRRRRRQVFVVLLDAAGLSLIMGLVPPLRPILYASGGLVLVLLLYTAFLIRIRGQERERARVRRAVESQRHLADAEGYGSPSPAGLGRGGWLARHPEFVARSGHPAGSAPVRRPWQPTTGLAALDAIQDPDTGALPGGGVRIIEDDVHVIVYRSDEIEVGALRAGSAR